MSAINSVALVGASGNIGTAVLKALLDANFNIKNKSEQAQRIGLGQVKGFCAAAGVSWEEAKADTSVLIGRPFMARAPFIDTGAGLFRTGERWR